MLPLIPKKARSSQIYGFKSAGDQMVLIPIQLESAVYILVTLKKYVVFI